jgi:hypothetical protein
MIMKRLSIEDKLLVAFAIGAYSCLTVLELFALGVFAHYGIYRWTATFVFRCDPDPDIGCIPISSGIIPVYPGYAIWQIANWGFLIFFIAYTMGMVYRALNKRILKDEAAGIHTAWDWQGSP